MPRERVHHGKFEKVGELPPGAPRYAAHADGVNYQEQPSLDVGWNREGEWVQLSIDAPRVWWERWLKGHDDPDEVPHFAVFTDSLSRQEINHLIATLRRARDAAYGRDE